ncbi:hypothetical protein [Empedobacter tilapiae]
MNTAVNQFTVRPFYQIKVKTSEVGFDIRVNDYPLLQFNKEAGGGTEMEIPINPAILNSGKQYLDIKVFPLPNKSHISKSAEFEFEINKKNRRLGV